MAPPATPTGAVALLEELFCFFDILHRSALPSQHPDQDLATTGASSRRSIINTWSAAFSSSMTFAKGNLLNASAFA
ncbi:hypothetical protein SKAU_G00248440 [Synaphobranchus kaupii]|uniref:Uncharacterized protein n=1 Tax=Synaphobranchus kaupii TaxID=118154 RepID=A0A9Q1IPK1_SYNKA|nr:hypothetical protein SKAU_G00248440 [Synaphobranchus kaupii]